MLLRAAELGRPYPQSCVRLFLSHLAELLALESATDVPTSLARCCCRLQ